MSAAAAIAVAGFLLAACQQGVVPGNAYDKPWSFSGYVLPAGTVPTMTTGADGAMLMTKPIMSLLWTDPLQRSPDVPQPARGISSMVSQDKFQIDVYGPPPAAAIVDIPNFGGQTVRLALAEIVMIDDQNGDGTFEVSGADATIADGDRYLAGANTVLVYLDGAYASLPPGNVLAVSGAAGYQLVLYACDHHEAIANVLQQTPDGTIVYPQPSTTFPEVRACGRTHSP